MDLKSEVPVAKTSNELLSESVCAFNSICVYLVNRSCSYFYAMNGLGMGMLVRLLL